MKKYLFSGLLIMSGLTVNAQSFNYSSAAGWNSVQNTYTVPSGCSLGPLTSLSGAGTISINSGVVDYSDILGAHECRISTALGNFYDKEFNIDFDFNVTNTSSGKAIYLVALTSLDLSPDYAFPMTVCAQAPNMDLLGVRMYTPGGFSNANPGVGISLYENGTNLTPSDIIGISYGTTYYARVSVYENKHGELFIYNDATRSESSLVGSFCFDIPKKVNGLNYLQHSTIPGAGYARTTRAWVDNTNIYATTFDCCDIDITGPNVIYGEGTYTEYVVTGVHNPISSIDYEDVIYSLTADGMIIVEHWGGFGDEIPKAVTITTTGICQCEEITETKIIYVYPKGYRSSDQSVIENTSTAEPQARIFPNPTSNVITVEHKNEILSLVLIDASGKVLETHENHARSVTIDLSARPTGIYTLKIVTANGTQVEQVVKK